MFSPGTEDEVKALRSKLQLAQANLLTAQQAATAAGTRAAVLAAAATQLAAEAAGSTLAALQRAAKKAHAAAKKAEKLWTVAKQALKAAKGTGNKQLIAQLVKKVADTDQASDAADLVAARAQDALDKATEIHRRAQQAAVRAHTAKAATAVPVNPQQAIREMKIVVLQAELMSNQAKRELKKAEADPKERTNIEEMSWLTAQANKANAVLYSARRVLELAQTASLRRAGKAVAAAKAQAARATSAMSKALKDDEDRNDPEELAHLVAKINKAKAKVAKAQIAQKKGMHAIVRRRG